MRREQRWMALLVSAVGLLAGGCPAEGPSSLFRQAGAGAQASLPGDGERVWIVVEERGMRRSSGYQIRRVSSFRGQPCIVTERSRLQKVSRDGKVFAKEVRSKVVTATSGSALYAWEQVSSGTERREETVSIENGTATFEETGPGGTRRETLSVPPNTPFGIEPSWLVSRSLAPGRSFERTVLDRVQRKLMSEHVEIIGSRLENVLGTEMRVWEARIRRAGYTPQSIFFTESGQFVRIEDGALVVRVASAEEAQAEPEPVTITNTIKLGFELPAWDNFNELVYQVLPAEEWRQHLTQTEYVTVRDEGAKLLVQLNRTPPMTLRLQKVSLPMDVPPDIQPHLGEGARILPQKTPIARKAREVIGRETDVLQCAALLAGWVHQEIRYGARDSLNPSPLVTLESRGGSCSEHADLYASLARSVGIPTRHCQGLLIQRDEAVFHAWVEVWIGGVWVPVDTTVNRVGLPAGYLLTARGTGDGEPKDPFGWRLRQGDLQLRLQEARKVHLREEGAQRIPSMFALEPDEKRSYVAVDEGWMANLYWGFSIHRPEAWQGKINLDSVELTSPDGGARLVIEGMDQVYRADPGGLERIVESLRVGLSDVRMNDSRVQPFGTVRPTESLMTDFTCVESGRRLRCRQYVIPKRGRSYRIAAWAADDRFKDFIPVFNEILSSVDL